MVNHPDVARHTQQCETQNKLLAWADAHAKRVSSNTHGGH
ncbi:hypothetical protein VCRA2123O74_410015 [Vibrio crassostreae]|nr:hypothetical protein VCRA2123O74_410015 [Vibrio crassostreae]CAK3859971.1 hypothetical protein VCRA2121O337_320042 [Vibrio crassostreae]CAK3953429.1 hypothetical protein VCRA212O16_450015 [Vibrio crassostreae]